uniref:Uncharacterized protein n=1 Tax=Romanomermis culicivorax TaxID=13658 RepID=A0A915J2W5_ROMCU
MNQTASHFIYCICSKSEDCHTKVEFGTKDKKKFFRVRKWVLTMQGRFRRIGNFLTRAKIETFANDMLSNPEKLQQIRYSRMYRRLKIEQMVELVILRIGRQRKLALPKRPFTQQVGCDISSTVATVYHSPTCRKNSSKLTLRLYCNEFFVDGLALLDAEYVSSHEISTNETRPEAHTQDQKVRRVKSSERSAVPCKVQGMRIEKKPSGNM